VSWITGCYSCLGKDISYVGYMVHEDLAGRTCLLISIPRKRFTGPYHEFRIVHGVFRAIKQWFESVELTPGMSVCEHEWINLGLDKLEVND